MVRDPAHRRGGEFITNNFAHLGGKIWGQGSNLRPVGPEPTALPLSYPRVLSDCFVDDDDPTHAGMGMSGGRARTCVQSGESRSLYH